MSYDLYLVPREGSLDAATFDAYFSTRSNFKVEGSQAWYQNEDTDVYFVFEFREGVPEDAEDPDASYPVALNINFFRPSYFVLEAEAEVTAFVRHFDMLVSDPQTSGMGQGEYDAAKLVSGWTHGNEFAYSAFLRDPDSRQGIKTLPTESLIRAWRWNRNRKSLQTRLGETRFVPLVMFTTVDGQPATAATWPDGIPIAVPEVDYFIVARKDFAPKKLFRRKPDHTIVPYKAALPMLQRHRTAGAAEFVLNYDVPPKEIASYVEALPRLTSAIERISADQMLNRELVERVV